MYNQTAKDSPRRNTCARVKVPNYLQKPWDICLFGDLKDLCKAWPLESGFRHIPARKGFPTLSCGAERGEVSAGELQTELLEGQSLQQAPDIDPFGRASKQDQACIKEQGDSPRKTCVSNYGTLDPKLRFGAVVCMKKQSAKEVHLLVRVERTRTLGGNHDSMVAKPILSMSVNCPVRKKGSGVLLWDFGAFSFHFGGQRSFQEKTYPVETWKSMQMFFCKQLGTKSGGSASHWVPSEWVYKN